MWGVFQSDESFVRLLSRVFVALTMGFWVAMSLQHWNFNAAAIVLPESDHVFQDLNLLFREFRWVTPLVFMPLVGFVATYLPVALWCLVFFLAFRAPPLGSFGKFAFALGVGSFVYWNHSVGKGFHDLLDVGAQLFLFGYLLRRSPRWLESFVLFGLALACVLVFRTLEFHFYWACLIYSLSNLVHFLVVDRAKLNRFQRRAPGLTSLQLISQTSLVVALLLLISFSDPYQALDLTAFHESYLHLALVILVPLLSIAITFLSPWESILWMRMGMLGLGLLLSPSLLFINLIALGFLLLKLIPLLLERLSKNKMTFWNGRPLRSIVLASLFSVASLSLIQKEMQRPRLRELSFSWSNALQNLGNSNSSPGSPGLLVVGPAFSFLSFFWPGPILQLTHKLLEMNEAEWLKWMSENKLNYIVVDTHWLKEFWRSELKANRSPNQISQSLLSRLTVYEGKYTETPTSKLAAVENFVADPASHLEILVFRKREPL